MPISKRDLKMMTDNELFNGMTLVRMMGMASMKWLMN